MIKGLTFACRFMFATAAVAVAATPDAGANSARHEVLEPPHFKPFNHVKNVH
jgi:hypothetical protein